MNFLIAIFFFREKIRNVNPIKKPNQELLLNVITKTENPIKNAIKNILFGFSKRNAIKKISEEDNQIPKEFAWSKVPTGLKANSISSIVFPKYSIPTWYSTFLYMGDFALNCKYEIKDSNIIIAEKREARVNQFFLFILMINLRYR